MGESQLDIQEQKLNQVETYYGSIALQSETRQQIQYQDQSEIGVVQKTELTTESDQDHFDDEFLVLQPILQLPYS